MLSPLLALALVGLPTVSPTDGLAPLTPALAQVGRSVDLVLRPTPSGCRLLLSDAETDAPLANAHVVVRSFGAVGAAPTEVVANAGNDDGHYLFECAPTGQGLVVELPQASAPELFALSAPAIPAAAAVIVTKPRPWPLALALVVLALVLLVIRRAARPVAVAALLCVTAHASAHGVDEAAVPVAPGTEIHVAQEIQFALGLRTASVVVGAFAPSDGAPAGASRQYPAVPASAVVERDGKKLVFVRLQPELFVGREVTLGWTNGEQVAVISGLNPTEHAVVSGGAFLRNGGATEP